MDCSSPGFFIISQSLFKLKIIELVIPSNRLILCCLFLLLPLVFPSIRVFSSEFALRIRWPKYWSFCISPSLHPIYQQILLALPSIYISSWPLSSTSASLRRRRPGAGLSPGFKRHSRKYMVCSQNNEETPSNQHSLFSFQSNIHIFFIKNAIAALFGSKKKYLNHYEGK